MATWYDPRTWRRRRPPAMVAAAPLPRTSPDQALAEDTSVPPWARDSWRHYNRNGELRFAARWAGRAVSQGTLIAAKVKNPNEPPEPLPEDHPAQIEVAELCGGKVGQSRFLKQAAMQLFVGGDSRLILWETGENGREWAVRTPRQIRNAGEGKISIRINGLTGATDFILPPSALIVPMRETHPDDATEPDSSVRAILADLAQIEWCTNMITSLTRSRLVMLGILMMSSKLDFPGRRGVLDPVTGKPIRNLDTFWDSLVDGASEWIDNPLAPEAGVPFLLAGDAEQIKATQLVQFATDTIDRLIKVREDSRRSVALGVDLPPEILTGLGESKFYNAIAITSEAIKITVEPLFDTINDGLTDAWLRPTLKAAKYAGDDLDQLVVWRDLTGLTVQPNKAEVVQDAFDRYAVSFKAYREALGIPEEDKASDEEIAYRLQLAMAQRRNISSAADTLGEFAFPGSRTAVNVDGARTSRDDGGRRGQRAPSTLSAPSNVTPIEQARPAVMRPGLAAAARAMVTHALDYTGRRYAEKVMLPHDSSIPPAELYQCRPVPTDAISPLMDGVWDNHWKAAPEALTAAVDAHVRWLLLKGEPFALEQVDHIVRTVNSNATA